jgi:hypothetical protein
MIALRFQKLLWCAPRVTQLVTLLIVIAAVCRLIERRLKIPTGDDPNESLVDRQKAWSIATVRRLSNISRTRSRVWQADMVFKLVYA